MMSRRGNISAEQLEEEEFSRAVSSAETVPPPQNQNKSSRATRNSSRTRSTAAASSSNKSKSRKRSSKGNSRNHSKHPSGNDKLYSNFPSRDTYDELTHEGKPPLPSANTIANQPPGRNLQLVKAMNGNNLPDPNVDLTELFNMSISCTEEDIEEFSEGIGDKSGNLPEETWDLSNDNVIMCEECDKAPATTRPVVPATHSKKGKPGVFPNTTCATCANKSPEQFMKRPCCMADGNEVKEGLKTCTGCRENRVCVNFETCNGKKRYNLRGSVFEKCETCYKESIAVQQCKNCPNIGVKEGTALCDDCAKLSNCARQDKHKGRDKDERCERCYNLLIEGGQRYHIKGGSGGGLRVCERNECNKKCRVVLRVGGDGKNIYCDDPIMAGDRNQSCGGFSQKKVNGSYKRVHKCHNTANTYVT